jgi:mono/diheme cytochrome c family protein
MFSMAKLLLSAAVLVSLPLTAWAQQLGYPGGNAYPFGTPATNADIEAWEQCAACHGAKLEGMRDPSLPQGGGPALIGGRGTLNTAYFKMTVESYWPYASTLFDYITRAMPYTAPGSLKPDQVYSLVAFILGEGNIVGKNAVMDAKSLPKVQMPNKDGFYLDNRPYPVKRYD